jgi:hypothetical protein
MGFSSLRQAHTQMVQFSQWAVPDRMVCRRSIASKCSRLAQDVVLENPAWHEVATHASGTDRHLSIRQVTGPGIRCRASARMVPHGPRQLLLPDLLAEWERRERYCLANHVTLSKFVGRLLCSRVAGVT